MSPGSVERSRRSSHPVGQLFLALGLLAVVIGAIVVGFLALYKEFWGPGAFAERYVETIAAGDASGALAIPGVTPEFAELEEIDRGYASEALLRSAALVSEIDDVRVVDDVATVTGDREVHVVTLEFTLDGESDQMVFRVERDEGDGLVPAWRFETSPLAVIDLTVRGSWRFSVNDFEIDKRQISPAGVDAEPLDTISLLTFSPGVYDVSVDTAATSAPAEEVRATGLLEKIPLDIQTVPTRELTNVVQSSVENFLDETCTTQSVLQPGDCPFGYDASWGIAQPDIEWSIATYPRTALVPDGDDWRVSSTSGVAHISLSVLCYSNGAVIPVDEDVHFTMIAEVDVRDDGGVHITIDRDGEQPPTANHCA